MVGNPNGPWSFASPMGGGTAHGEIISINSADNSVQVKFFGYEDGVEKEKTEWIKCLGQHAGLAGATATHNYFPGTKVMISMAGGESFVLGSVTGHDSDKAKKDGSADNSEDKDPNVPRQVRGSKGEGNRAGLSTGEGSDPTSKGTRNVTKTTEPYGDEKQEKIYDYAKGKAPFDKGNQSKFPDLKSIGIPMLSQGSNVLDTIDKMDNNISGAIKASTKIIKNMEKGGFGDAMSLLNGGGGGDGGSADQGTKEVTDYFGIVQFQELLAALEALLEARRLVKAAGAATSSSDLSPVPVSLTYTTFGVDPGLQLIVQGQVIMVDSSVGQSRIDLLNSLGVNFDAAFAQAAVNSVAYVTGLVAEAGTSAILVIGTTSTDTLIELLAVLQTVAALAGLPPTVITSIGNGEVGQMIQQGASAIQSILSQGQSLLDKVSKMAQDMNTFAPEMNAMSEIMGGAASIKESLTGIVMKFAQKKSNFDARGFTK